MATILSDSLVDPSAEIRAGAVIGQPFRRLLSGDRWEEEPAMVAARAYVGFGAVVYCGAHVAEDAIVDDACSIGPFSRIGARTLVTHRAHIDGEVSIGSDCVVGGFIGERTKIGNFCRVFGQLIHSQFNPLLPWDEAGSEEKSAVLGDGSFIGFGAHIVGGVSVGVRAYVCAGALVTRSVPERYIAWGTNEMVHYSRFLGRLAWSPFFKEGM